MNLSKEYIRKEAGRDIYRRGEKYYLDRRVTLISIDLEKFEAEIEGKVPYRIKVQEIGQTIYSSCTCPYWTTCKHVVAAMLEALDWYEEHGEDLRLARSNPSWKRFFERTIDVESATPIGKRSLQQWRVIYLIELNNESWSITPQKAYVKKNGFLGRFANIGDLDLSSNEILYSPNDPIIISHIQRIDHQNNAFYNSRYFGRTPYSEQVYHYRYASPLGPLFDLLRESLVYKSPFEDQLSPLTFESDPAEISLEFETTNSSYLIVPHLKFKGQVRPLNSDYKVLTQNPIWLIKDRSLIKVSNITDAGILVPFTKSDLQLSIPESEFPEFLETIYPQLVKSTPLSLPENLKVRELNNLTGKSINLSEGERHLNISLRFSYGDINVDFSDPQTCLYKQQDHHIVLVQRDKDSEREIYNRLLETGLKEDPRGDLRIIDSKALKWLFNFMPKLSKEGFDFNGREQLKKYKVRTGEPNVRVVVSSKIDWFDLNIAINVEGVVLPLRELKKAIRQNTRYIKLADNSIAQLSEEWFAKFQHMFNFSTVEKDTVKIQKYHVTLIDVLFKETESLTTDSEFWKSLKQMRDFEGIEKKTLPKGLKGQLRPYQKSGYNWLYFLHNYHFSGCLADDMGLGKTVQTLALLLNEKQQKAPPSLIVCPTSVVYNWEKEVSKFTPDLKVLIHTGLQRDRDVTAFQKYDIILTSYGIMRRDILLLKSIRFHYVILDESHKIKNPASQTAKAARILKSNHRLVLTGTPVENNTIELWSQFAFLNPGLLGSLNYFKKAFTYPIEKRKDHEAAAFLRQLIYPFVLRRTKEGVARELPPKIEQTYYCTMNPEQQRLYALWKDHYRAMILEKIDQVGLDRARINVLEGLVKLRQIACHPFLVDKSIREDSGKFESLKEVIEEIVAENHKVLIFSQFVRMLKVIREYLDEDGILYEYLDGHTTHRMRHVDRFQNDPDISIFLISLKAGGVGLNLTAADYVIHYDPWWNPAVEVQATDRAHRIGQDKKVNVYRLITKDSVEEKMLQLQAKKKKLVSDLITTDSSFFKSLTTDDINILFG